MSDANSTTPSIATLFARVGADVQEYAAAMENVRTALSDAEKDEAIKLIAELGLDPKITTGIAAAVQTANKMADWMPQVGDKYRVDYGKGHFANQLLHVRGIVDDEVVVRHWHKRKHYWVYKLEPIWYFDPSEGFRVSKVKSRTRAGAGKGVT